MSAFVKKSSRGAKKSGRRAKFPGEKIQTRHISGRWKLVYADFVTVLMAFFIVAWILRIDFTSKSEFVSNSLEKERDRSCTTRIAQSVREKLAADPSVDADNPPIQVVSDYDIDGARFTLVDSQAPMFETGEATLSAFAEPHLRTIAEAASQCSEEHKLRIEGYTDATPFPAGSVRTNWELSAERANAARRKLIELNIAEQRIEAVTGYGQSRPAIRDNPSSPLNRRVSITVIAPLKFKTTTPVQSSPVSSTAEVTSPAQNPTSKPAQ